MRRVIIALLAMTGLTCTEQGPRALKDQRISYGTHGANKIIRLRVKTEAKVPVNLRLTDHAVRVSPLISAPVELVITNLSPSRQQVTIKTDQPSVTWHQCPVCNGETLSMVGGEVVTINPELRLDYDRLAPEDDYVVVGLTVTHAVEDSSE